MREDNVSEALIFYTNDEYSIENVAEKHIYRLLIEKDNVKVWPDFNIIEHENGNKIKPCLVLLDADIKYVMLRAVMYHENDFIIQCIIMDSGEFKINKYELIKYDDTGFSVN